MRTSSAYAQCFKTASATKKLHTQPLLLTCTNSSLTRQNSLLLVCTKAAPLCIVHSWRIFKIKASCLSITCSWHVMPGPFHCGCFDAATVRKNNKPRTNWERKEAMQCVLVALGFCIKANMCKPPGLDRFLFTTIVFLSFCFHCHVWSLHSHVLVRWKHKGFRTRARDYFQPFSV